MFDYFSQQKGPIVARATQSQARTTQRYARSSSSFSAGCASTLTAARTLASNSTTSGASGCRKPRKHTTRSVKTDTHQDSKHSLLAHMTRIQPAFYGFMRPTKKESPNICLFFWSIRSHLIAFANGGASYNLQTVTTTDGKTASQSNQQECL